MIYYCFNYDELIRVSYYRSDADYWVYLEDLEALHVKAKEQHFTIEHNEVSFYFNGTSLMLPIYGTK